MRILSISQVYWPDTASTAQHLSDLLEFLSNKGHEVTVITSNRKYENPKIVFPRKELNNGVSIIRIKNSGFGKKRKVFRLIDFITFNLLILLKLLMLKKESFDVIIGMTSPPLLSYIGLKIARLKKIKFVYWTMDLQPELSISAGYLSENSNTTKLLQAIGDYIFKNSDKIIALDKYMANHVQQRIGFNNNTEVIPVWPVTNKIYEGERLKNPFRIENDFGDRIVIMYSGNHSVMHPLSTLLNTAKELKDNDQFLFVHIGGGVRLNEVLDFKSKNDLNNIIVLSYQPREKIHLSLGSSDIQVVSMGNNCVGFTHPNKIYGSMFLSKPILYIGHENSHISDILMECPGNIFVRHGDTKGLCDSLINFNQLSDEEKETIGKNNRTYILENFHPNILKEKMANAIECI
jgi:glycosyltransferase involved in cell wall biosynthesis